MTHEEYRAHADAWAERERLAARLAAWEWCAAADRREAAQATSQAKRDALAPLVAQAERATVAARAALAAYDAAETWSMEEVGLASVEAPDLAAAVDEALRRDPTVADRWSAYHLTAPDGDIVEVLWCGPDVPMGIRADDSTEWRMAVSAMAGIRAWVGPRAALGAAARED